MKNLHKQWQTVQSLIILLPWEQSDQGQHCFLRHICCNIRFMMVNFIEHQILQMEVKFSMKTIKADFKSL